MLVVGFVPACAQTRYPIDLEKAEKAFSEARQISDRDAGRLWGKLLYGPMLFVDLKTRAVVANEPDAEGLLHSQEGVYVGALPESVPMADSPTEWAGKRWTMLRWPMPEDTLTRRVEFAHEMFHRIQPELHLDAPDTPSPYLDTANGRLWLELEWRALSAALIDSGPAQSQAIADALAFRNHRRQMFPGSAESERNLEIAEGIPEYTGVAAGAPDSDSARWRAIEKLTDPDLTITFVRSFAYTSGPAYGLLLDQRLPQWRTRVAAESDLGEMLAATIPHAPAVSAEKRAALYGQTAIRIAEDDRAAKADAEKARYRALLVDGPTLTLPNAKNFHFSFNPSTLISLGAAGTVYPTFHASDAWGILDVKEGVLIPTDFGRAILTAPTNTKGRHLQGPGWTLDLANGWHVVPSSRAGSYTVQKE
jgi:hypothetical protein